MAISIRIVTETLSDRSKVFDVIVSGDEAKMRFNCYDKKHAMRFQETLAELIDECTTEKASQF